MPYGRVAVADDHGPTREVLCELLRADGWTVLEARDGVELVRLAADNHLSAVVTDLSMPRLDGLRAGRALRREPTTAELLLVAITARSLTEDQRRELDGVFDYVIRKPVPPTELRQDLRLAAEA